jgi:hypothetical protein
VSRVNASVARPWAGLDALVEPLAPGPGGEGVEAFLSRTLAPGAYAAPFAPARLEALRGLSEALLAHPLLGRDPATTAVAFWMRPAAIAKLRASFDARVPSAAGTVIVPVGRVFHLAPANVDTMFVYSWALSFLCGNANVVRLSRERGAVVEAILEVLRGTARSHPLIADENRFVTYEHDAEVTTALSAWCSHRVIWGGDEAVATIRPLPLPSHASERVFGSKFSYSVFAAPAYAAASDAQRQQLASAFFNDMFWFDQMACSSPHLLFWVGDAAATTAAVGAFEEALEAEIVRRRFVTQAASAVHRRAYAFELAADADVRVRLGHPGFVGIEVRDERGLERTICGGGLLRHARLDRIEEVAGYAIESDQTVTHFGFAADALTALAPALGARGVDRLVPVGEALAFDPVWDGFDLFADFTRRIRVKPA